MQYYDVYDWPKNYIEDSMHSKNMELENVFVDDYIAKVLNTKVGDTDEIHEAHLEELLSIISNLASFYSRLRVTVDEILGNLIVERLLDEADREAEERAGGRGPEVGTSGQGGDLPFGEEGHGAPGQGRLCRDRARATGEVPCREAPCGDDVEGRNHPSQGRGDRA